MLLKIIWIQGETTSKAAEDNKLEIVHALD
jgi:hypothetical protein